MSSSGRVKINGLNMYYEVVGEGPPVVLIAGLASDHLEWALFHVPVLVNAGYRCVLFDNRDAGLTGDSLIDSYSIQQFADDTAELLKQLNVGAAHIVGESMGGMIAQELAIHYPELVRSLSLLCTTGRSEPYLDALRRSWIHIRRNLTEVDAFQSIGLWLFSKQFYENPALEQAWLEEVRSNPHPQSVSGFERQWKAIMTHNALDRLHRIPAPTHIVAGDEDIIFPLRQSKQMADNIAGSRLTIFPGLAHVAAFERPDKFNPVAIDFFKQH
jgi:3-oxoadipate enol-lactonase